MNTTKYATGAEDGRVVNDSTEDLSPMVLLEAIEAVQHTLVLRAHIIEARATRKARDIEAIITHWILRIAAYSPTSGLEACAKALFLTRVLEQYRFTLAPIARAMADAALAFDAEPVRVAPSD